jgi:sortase (surface protein transpeptidase)
MTRHAVGGRDWPGVLAALALGMGLIAWGVAGLVLSHRGAVPRPAASRVPAPAGRAASVPRPDSARAVARPVRLTIPAIGVRARLIRLGLTAGGALQVPASVRVAGWYDRSPRPGAIGGAIIAGHVDSMAGPAVFFRLRSLRPGDRAYVRRADGTLAVFGVTAVRLYPKDRFPTAAVYGPAAGAQLRLITCGGTFDPATGSYLSNVVVYAVAIAPRDAKEATLGRLLPAEHS